MASKKKAATEPQVEPIVVKIMQAVRPGDVVIIECDEARTTQQLKHLTDKFKATLPEVRIVILNKGARVTQIQTTATIATKATPVEAT